MKKWICFLLAMLLFAGCANTGGEPATTERKPGWSVSGSEPGDATQSAELTDEELLQEQDKDQWQWEPEYDEEGNLIIGGESHGSSGTAGYSDSSAGLPSYELSLTERRQLVVQEMREMMTLLWTPDRDITYYITGLRAEPVAVTLKKGTIYQGMPYTNGNASRYSFLSYSTGQTNGVYTLSGLTQETLSGNGVPRIGNSCSSALFWAWGRVANSITYRNTMQMTEAYGCLPVGDYTAPYHNYGDRKSVDICKENGEQVMFESYAKMLPGDGMVFRTGNGGHAIMVVSMNVVRKADGTIDAGRSTATIIDQSETQELDQKTVNVPGVGNVVVFQEIDRVRTFAWLYQSGYLPVTCKELNDPSALPEAMVTDCTNDPTAANMFSGMLQGNYRISSVTVTVLDSTGKTVQKATCHGSHEELYTFNLYRFTQQSEKPARQGTVDVNTLPAGTYRVVFTCRLSTGDNLTFRDFTITK